MECTIGIGALRYCRHCSKEIMWTTYNGKVRWCHVPLLRIRCSDTQAEPKRDEDDSRNG